jgi:hypothetical protein
MERDEFPPANEMKIDTLESRRRPLGDSLGERHVRDAERTVEPRLLIPDS